MGDDCKKPAIKSVHRYFNTRRARRNETGDFYSKCDQEARPQKNERQIFFYPRRGTRDDGHCISCE